MLKMTCLDISINSIDGKKLLDIRFIFDDQWGPNYNQFIIQDIATLIMLIYALSYDV